MASIGSASQAPSVAATPQAKAASRATWAYHEHDLEITFSGTGYLETESGFTIFYADSKDDDGAEIEPKLVFTDEFYDDDNNAAEFDKVLEWWEAKRLGGVRALVSGKMRLTATYSKTNSIYGTLMVTKMLITKEPTFKRKRPTVDMPSFSMYTKGGTKKLAAEYEKTRQGATSPQTPTPARGATPATQTGKILSKALSNEDLEKIGSKLAQDFVEEDWSDTEKTKTSAKSTPKVGAVGSTNKAGITTANSPFATNTPQQSTLIKAAKPTHTSSGSEAVLIDLDKGGGSSVRKRIVKGKPDVDEGDEDDSDQEETRTPAPTTPTASEKEKKPRKKRTSKGKTKD